ncbi:hypothetical protein [Acinetobacter kyonggiensis]|uniref:Uncharacterized protein n=1 Tax=Acinetobacter kyonggiensis TaxID=595670 RepID=A0A1H3JGU7_9GAMM|nr:hypothetical protein [Acinetobacter kyonggiensis]SDY38809.1 hypothetical protein SAMN05421643_10944 [Acinetobacter kyonggiensis]
MNKLPINGRIILVDDKIDQVQPLMNYFSKNKIPFTYFDGKFENFPEEGFDDIRILFLDINLFDDTVPSHQDFRALQPVVDKLISRVSHPYLLVLWTRDPDVFNNFKMEFFQNSPLKEKSPIDILTLEKSKFFSYSGEVLDGDINDLEQELCSKLDNYPELQCILHWESMVHKVTNEIASIFFPKFGEYETWSEETKKMFTQFSKASLGKYFSDADASTRINSAFEVIHQVFMDELETQFYKAEKKLELENLDQTTAPNFKINTKLLIQNHDHLSNDYPGSLISLDNNDASAFFSSIIDQDQLKNAVCKNYNFSLKEGDDRFNELSPSQQSKKCSAYKKDEITGYLQKVQLRIDPLCDYVQQKIQHSKCVDGILIPEIAYNLIDKRSEAIYISPIFEYQENNVALVVDFRTFQTKVVVKESTKLTGGTVNEQIQSMEAVGEILDEDKAIFRLRSALLADIQSKFARHANRQGLLYL